MASVQEASLGHCLRGAQGEGAQGEASDCPMDLTPVRGERRKDLAHRTHTGFRQSQPVLGNTQGKVSC